MTEFSIKDMLDGTSILQDTGEIKERRQRILQSQGYEIDTSCNRLKSSEETDRAFKKREAELRANPDLDVERTFLDMQLTLWVRTAETRARIEAEMTRNQTRSI